MAGKKAFNRHTNLGNWALRHIQVLLSSLGRLIKKPLSTLLTASVIGITLSLPIGLHTIIGNLQTLGDNWQGASSLSVFLSAKLKQDKITALTSALESRPEVAKITYITPEQAMEEFRQLSGFSEALELLEENPLPPVLLVRLAPDYSDAEQTGEFARELEKLPEVELAEADLQWVRRFQGITEIVQRGSMVLAALLGLAVILIMGNTIRLEIQNRHKEIEIIKLVGGTNAFIQRPFLYEGFWYGLLGGLIAWLLLLVSLSLLSGPVSRLALLYESDFSLPYLPLSSVLITLIGSTLLGLSGAWVAVKQHLSSIEPD